MEALPIGIQYVLGLGPINQTQGNHACCLDLLLLSLSLSFDESVLPLWLPTCT